MKKLYVIMLIVVIGLAGCTKTTQQKLNENSPSPAPTSSAAISESPAPSPKASADSSNKAYDNAPSFEEFEKLKKELENTTDETKRREILDKLQVILEQVESRGQ